MLLECPSCKAKLRAKSEHLGKKLKCPRCATVMSAPVQRKAGERTGKQCPRCHTPMQSGAVLCVECGYHFKAGRVLRTEVKQDRLGAEKSRGNPSDPAKRAARSSGGTVLYWLPRTVYIGFWICLGGWVVSWILFPPGLAALTVLVEVWVAWLTLAGAAVILVAALSEGWSKPGPALLLAVAILCVGIWSLAFGYFLGFKKVARSRIPLALVGRNLMHGSSDADWPEELPPLANAVDGIDREVLKNGDGDRFGYIPPPVHPSMGFTDSALRGAGDLSSSHGNWWLLLWDERFYDSSKLSAALFPNRIRESPSRPKDLSEGLVVTSSWSASATAMRLLEHGWPEGHPALLVHLSDQDSVGTVGMDIHTFTSGELERIIGAQKERRASATEKNKSVSEQGPVDSQGKNADHQSKGIDDQAQNENEGEENSVTVTLEGWGETDQYGNPMDVNGTWVLSKYRRPAAGREWSTKTPSGHEVSFRVFDDTSDIRKGAKFKLSVVAPNSAIQGDGGKEPAESPLGTWKMQSRAGVDVGEARVLHVPEKLMRRDR